MTTDSDPLLSDDALDFYRRRVAGFGLGGAILAGFFVVFDVIFQAAMGHLDPFEPTMLWQLAGVFTMVAVFAACRWGPRRKGFIRSVEAGGLLIACGCFELMGLGLPPAERPELILVLALTLLLVARSVYVPSSARRSLILALLAGLPLPFVAYTVMLRLDFESFLRLAPMLADHTREEFARHVAISSLCWWAASVAIATATSRVVYGLRRELREVRRLGQYLLEAKLGEGGMGVVYRAKHGMLRRPTAIKLISAPRVGAENIARFEREVQLTAGLSHPNTVTVFDYGRTPDGIFYYAMELLEGANLAEIVAASGPQPPARVVRILCDVASALAEAHSRGLIHRDIKPANIMLCERGGLLDVTKVLDFGLVKSLSPGQPQLTNVEEVTGTPHFMAPESLTAPEALDPRSDLYALGAVGYFLLTGSEVFSGATVVEVLGHHLHSAPVPPSERLGKPLPPELDALIMRCLAKKPEDRPDSAKALEALLRGCPGIEPWTQQDATRWWSAHASALGARKASEQGSAGERTIAVDLARRS